jgi:hypothetical protein
MLTSPDTTSRPSGAAKPRLSAPATCPARLAVIVTPGSSATACSPSGSGRSTRSIAATSAAS